MNFVKRIERFLALERIYTMTIFGHYFFPNVMLYMAALSFIPMAYVLITGPLFIPFINFTLLPDHIIQFTWLVWWPIFLFTIFFVSRLWCGGFCPWGVFVDIGNKLRSWSNKGPLQTINLGKWVFLGPFLFLTVGYLHDAGAFTNSIIMTLEFTFLFFIFAFVIGVWLPRRSFCRNFCFLGQLPGIFGRLSFVTLRTDKELCNRCVDKPCLRGTEKAGKCPTYIDIPNFNSNRHCLLCGNCIKNCPYDNLKITFVKPGSELIAGAGLNFGETLFTLFLLGELAMFVAMESMLLMNFSDWMGIHSMWLLTLLYSFFAILVVIGCYLISTFITAVWGGISLDKAIASFGFIYLPFVYLALVRDVIVTYAIKGSFLNFIFTGFTLEYVNLGFLVIGAGWSIWLAFDMIKAQKVKGNTFILVLPHILVISLLVIYWLPLSGHVQPVEFIAKAINFIRP